MLVWLSVCSKVQTCVWLRNDLYCVEWGVKLYSNQPTQLMALQLTVCCFSKIQIGFTFLVPAYPVSPIKWAIKRLYVVFYLVFRPGSRILSRGGANIGTYHSICNRGPYIGKKVIIRGWGGARPPRPMLDPGLVLVGLVIPLPSQEIGWEKRL